jgi:hypothetical protein
VLRRASEHGVPLPILTTLPLPSRQDEYPGVFRFSAPVFPSEDDHVVTAPYNALLAAARLIEDADCVLPVENQALLDITSRLDRAAPRPRSGGGGAAAPDGGAGGSGNKPWDAMNGVAAGMLLHLTAGMRFEGSLNVDLNDITSNLVPFPRMHFLLSALAPLAAPRDVGRLAAPRSMDQVGARAARRGGRGCRRGRGRSRCPAGGGPALAPDCTALPAANPSVAPLARARPRHPPPQLFTDAFSRDHQLIWAEPRQHTFLATALLMRGAASVGDAQRNLARLRGGLRLAHWNEEVCVGGEEGECAGWPRAPRPSPPALSHSLCLTPPRRYAPLWPLPPPLSAGLQGRAVQPAARGPALLPPGAVQQLLHHRHARRAAGPLRQALPPQVGGWGGWVGGRRARGGPGPHVPHGCGAALPPPRCTLPGPDVGSDHTRPMASPPPTPHPTPPPAPRLFLHHYEEYMDASGFDAAAEAVASVRDAYRAADGARPAPVARLAPRGLGFV